MIPLKGKTPVNLHEGHRERLRERFRLEGLDNFAPHEVLELILFYARARGDVNPLAHRLLDTFGSLKSVLEAPVDQLCMVDGVGPETATLLSLMVPVFRRYALCLCEEKTSLRNFCDAEEYCRALLTGMRKERFYMVCLSAQMRVLGHRLLSEGTLTEVPAYPRLIVETALTYNAHSVVLCHNHPAGLALPSRMDIDLTYSLDKVLASLGIMLLDHVVVGDGGTHSMVRNGDYHCSIMEDEKLAFTYGEVLDGDWA